MTNYTTLQSLKMMTFSFSVHTKKIVKFIKDTIMVSSDNDISIWHRDHFLRLQSFVYFQFSAATFSNLIKFLFLVATTMKTFLVYFKYPWSTASKRV
ncbi:hypothetical protein C0J52_14320 [Blattella germanica]|nr:hypothetical protein C0J52_14320 [Blattella germanica]